MPDIVVNFVLPTIITIIGAIIFVVVCTLLTRNKNEKIRLLPVKIVFFVLVALEIWKIYTLIGQNGGFYPNRYPIVFCSMVMYTYPLFCFKKNRFSQMAMAFSVIPFMIGFVAVIASMPGYTMSLMHGHSYVYHGLMFAVSIYLITSGLYKFRLKDSFPLVVFLGGYVIMCNIISLFIGGDISLFGPDKSQLKFIYDLFGYSSGNLVLILVVAVLVIATYAIIDLCQKSLKKRKESKHV